VFISALDLLDEPHELYRQGGPEMRRMLNKTIFTKLKIDRATVTADELAAPFDAIVRAGRRSSRATYQRKRPPVAVSGVAFHQGISGDVLTDADLLELALEGTGSSKPAMVELMRLYLNPRISGKQLENTRRLALTRPITPSSVAQPVRHASRLTDEDVARLSANYRSGSPAKALAAKFGVHRHTVAEVLERAGIERHTRGLTPAQVAQAIRLYRDGWSLAKVGHELGVTANTVRRYLLLGGVVMRSPNDRPGI
jgi:hypothetical protein